MPNLTKVTMGSFCRELVLQLEPLDALLKSWNLSEAEYETLRKSTFFRNELTVAVAEVKAMGSDAGFITRCKILSEDALSDMIKLMSDPTVAPGIKVDLFDKFTDLARLKAPKNVPAQQSVGQGGPSVVFNFGPGLEGVPQTMKVIPTTLEIEDNTDPTH